jgi:TPR repeat protein
MQKGRYWLTLAIQQLRSENPEGSHSSDGVIWKNKDELFTAAEQLSTLPSEELHFATTPAEIGEADRMVGDNFYSMATKAAAEGSDSSSQKEFDEAITWYQKAVALGDATAEDKLGQMYFAGLGVSADDAQSAAWYQKSAAQGNTDAQSQLKIVLQDEKDQRDQTGPYAVRSGGGNCCRSSGMSFGTFLFLEHNAGGGGDDGD